MGERGKHIHLQTVHFTQFVILSGTCLPTPCVRTFYDFSTAISKAWMCPRLAWAGRTVIRDVPWKIRLMMPCMESAIFIEVQIVYRRMSLTK